MRVLSPLLILLTGLLLGSAIGVATLGEPATTTATLAETVRFEAASPNLSAPSQTATDPRLLNEFRKLEANLNGLKADNRTLRRQLAETNRDLAELQFQVDSHSESFRPLGDDSGSRGATPLRSPMLQPLLPPKR